MLSIILSDVIENVCKKCPVHYLDRVGEMVMVQGNKRVGRNVTGRCSHFFALITRNAAQCRII